MSDLARRLLAATVLLALVVAMAGHYAAGADQHTAVGRSLAMLSAPDDHVGETVSFWATVERAGEDELVVRVDGATWTVVGATPPVEAGDVVQVRGTIRPGREIAAERVVVSERDRRTGMFAVSALAALLTAGAFLRTWTVDAASAAFVPRADAGGGEDDA